MGATGIKVEVDVRAAPRAASGVGAPIWDFLGVSFGFERLEIDDVDDSRLRGPVRAGLASLGRHPDKTKGYLRVL